MTDHLYQVETAKSPTALPASCAACSNVAARSKVEHVGTSVLVIPYCDECLRVTGLAATRQLAVLLASALSGVSFAGFSPLVWPWMGLGESLVLALGVALIPYVALFSVELRARPLFRMRRAAWGSDAGRLVGINQEWMQQVASLNHAQLSERSVAFRDRWAYPRLFWLTLVAPLLLGPPAFLLTHPKVWVLNLNRVPVDVSIDGHVVLTELAPTSGESPAAGERIRVAAGRRLWRTVDAQDRLIDERASRVAIGAEHLYAPGPHDYCFRLETTDYGLAQRSEASTTRERRLAAGTSFWVFDESIDTWFAPNPAAPRAGLPASGGQLTAVRQAHCLPPGHAGKSKSARDAAASGPVP